MADERDISAVYERHFSFMGHLLNKHPAKNIELFGHGGLRRITGKLPRCLLLFNQILNHVGYLDHIKIAEVRPNDFEIPQLTMSGNRPLKFTTIKESPPDKKERKSSVAIWHKE